MENVKHVGKSYWKADRIIIDAKLDELQIALKVKENKDGNYSGYSDSAEEEKDE